MPSFIQLSDLHIGKSADSAENRALQHIINDLISRFSGVDKPLIMLTGDLVEDGSKAQYRQAVALLSQLKDAGFTLLAAPGNHDYGPKGNFYTEAGQNNFQQFILRQLLGLPAADSNTNIMEQLYPLVYQIAAANEATPATTFIGLDTCEEVENLPLRFAAGAVGAAQLAALEQTLNGLPDDTVRVLYLHHHPFERVPGMQMNDAPAFMAAIAGRVDMVCFGHKHQAAVWNDRQEATWMIAAGKTTEAGLDGQFRLRHVEILDRERFVIRYLRVADPDFATSVAQLDHYDPHL